MKIVLASDVEPHVRCGAFRQSGVSVTKFAPRLWTEAEELITALQENLGSLSPAEIDDLGPARALYRSVGVDPTRRRPASEALVRRVLKGKGLYRINAAVDCCNYCSLRTFLPIGLYDGDKIRGEDVVIRLGTPDEWYEGHGKDRVNLEGHIVIADDEGPFGHPSADSKRTAVDLSTRNLLWILYHPRSYSQSKSRADLTFCEETLTAHCGGITEELSCPA